MARTIPEFADLSELATTIDLGFIELDIIRDALQRRVEFCTDMATWKREKVTEMTMMMGEDAFTPGDIAGIEKDAVSWEAETAKARNLLSKLTTLNYVKETRWFNVTRPTEVGGRVE
jgi:hypothetical protein